MAHAQLSPSTISYPTTTTDAKPHRQQQDGDDDNDEEDEDDNDQHQHDVPGQQISSPDYVDVEIPQSIGAGVSAPRPTVPRVHLKRGLPLLAPKAASAPRARLNPPLAQHSNDARLGGFRRAPPSRDGRGCHRRSDTDS